MFRKKMASKPKKKSQPSDPGGMFSGMTVFLIETGVQARRLQIWKQKLEQMGGKIEDRFTKNVTHVFAMDFDSLNQKIGCKTLTRLKAKALNYLWLEESLMKGEKVSEDSYMLTMESSGNHKGSATEENKLKRSDETHVAEDDTSPRKKLKSSPEITRPKSETGSGSPDSSPPRCPEITSPDLSGQHKDVPTSDVSSLYKPPDLNRNITEIFGKLIDIYKALGEERKSFSYYKAIPTIEKLPFKIENVDQVKNLPGIGKSLQDHIQEILNTGKLAKLEHFEKDEKIRTLCLFADVWGIGKVYALKFYEKGYRTLDDLKNDESLTSSQRLGLKYFDDIKTRIPRNEVQEMESLLKKVGEEILPGVDIICGGSYRRGKDSCGDVDIVITHPDGKSHAGFLSKFVKHLKGINFLREDMNFSTHSEEGTDHGIDTYFGLCTYPGRELRHRIDIKVYPRNIYAFGLIAWTGNDVLNRRLRSLAETKGFRLDDKGLFPATQSSGGKRGSKGTASLKFHTEREVFDFLGFPWYEPNERNL